MPEVVVGTLTWARPAASGSLAGRRALAVSSIPGLQAQNIARNRGVSKGVTEAKSSTRAYCSPSRRQESADIAGSSRRLRLRCRSNKDSTCFVAAAVAGGRPGVVQRDTTRDAS